MFLTERVCFIEFILSEGKSLYRCVVVFYVDVVNDFFFSVVRQFETEILITQSIILFFEPRRVYFWEIELQNHYRKL